MKIIVKLIAGFFVVALLAGLVGYFGIASNRRIHKNHLIKTNIKELVGLMDKSLILVLQLIETENMDGYRKIISDIENVRKKFDILHDITHERVHEMSPHVHGMIEEITKVSNRLITLQKEKIALNKEFAEKSVLDRELRHKIFSFIYALHDLALIRDTALMQYKNKEALYQYKDQEHLDKWMDSIEKIENGIQKLNLRKDDREMLLRNIESYQFVAQGLAEIVVEQKKFEDNARLTFTELKEQINSFQEEEEKIINKIRLHNITLANNASNLLISVTVGIILLSFIIGVYISRTISKPVVEFRDAAFEIAEGNLDKRVSISSRDEIGDLASAFNTMTTKLKKFYSDLDQMVKERTMELQMAHETLRESEEKYSNLVEKGNDGIVIIQEGILKFLNSKMAEIIGVSKEEALGKPFNDYVSESGKLLLKGNSMRISTEKNSNRYEIEIFSKDGRHIPVEIDFSLIEYQGRQADMAIVRNITERKKAEEQIQRHLNRLNALHSIDKAITSSFDLGLTADVLLTQVVTQLEVDAATILRLNPHTAMLEYIEGKGFRTTALKYTRLKLGESNAGRAAIERNIVMIKNLKENQDGFERSETFPDEGFISYIAVPLIAKGQVRGILELFHRSPLLAEPEWMGFVETIAGQAAIVMDNATLFEDLQRSNVELTLAYDSTIEGWSRALDMRDKETEGHSQRVTEMTLRIAREIGVKDEEFTHIRRGALLHDIGKMGIPDSILLKPGQLTDEEWEIMKNHPRYAYDMLKNIEYLRPALDIPHCHHEKWDGTGYPRELKGKEIPLAARIFAVVDVWDALCSDRPYRPAWPKEKVLEHIRSLSGTHFDPQIVETFLKIDL